MENQPFYGSQLSFQIKMDPRIERTDEQLVISNVTIWDTGVYTCEVEADLDSHITISHHLQVLGSNKQSQGRNFLIRKGYLKKYRIINQNQLTPQINNSSHCKIFVP